MIKLFFISSLLSVSMFANYGATYKSELVRADFSSQNTDKYRNDTLSTFTLKSLQEKNVFSDQQTLVRDYDFPDYSFGTIAKLSGACDDLGVVIKLTNNGKIQDLNIKKTRHTGTIYDINLKAGTVTCMFAEEGDLYNPIGLFNVHYPKIKEYYSLNKEQAKIDKADLIAKADEQFKPLYNKRKELSAEFNLENETYLNVTELLTASILTDTDVIDIEATSASGKLQLKDSFTSKFVTDRDSGASQDNSDYILTDSETIFSVYSALSDLSMGFLMLLVAFFAFFGGGRALLSPLADKLEKKQSHEKLVPWGTGLVAGMLLFFPVNDHEVIQNSNGENIAEFSIMKTRYQDFEKTGYYLFSEWANASAKAIIDIEMAAIIDKSGIGTKDQIINTYAGLVLEKKLNDFYADFNNACQNTVYDYSEMTTTAERKIYSEVEYMTFPVSESWAWASRLVNTGGKNYYQAEPYGLVKSTAYSIGAVDAVSKIQDGKQDSFYPMVSMSSCGKSFLKERSHSEKVKLYEDKLAMLSAAEGTDSAKIAMLEELIKFQYELNREWGYLSILGLPVTKMQTEYIGGLYKNRRSEVLEALNDDVKEDSYGAHMIFSSIPYLFVPGAGTVYKVISDNGGKIGATLGGGGGAAGGTAATGIGGLFSGAVGTVVGGLAGTVGGSALGAWAAYNVSKTVLELTPIIGIVIIGLVRFIIIMVKIFSFHFASLFLMPVMFAKENIQAISRFTMKILATMLELPIFVLAVWLAITANSLIHNIGDIFSKRVISGMLGNNAAQYELVEQSAMNNQWLSKIKIYVFDGFMEVAISAFSIIIIYKLIITLHNTLFEVLEIQGSQSLDNSIESMKNEVGGWGTKV